MITQPLTQLSTFIKYVFLLLMLNCIGLLVQAQTSYTSRYVLNADTTVIRNPNINVTGSTINLYFTLWPGDLEIPGVGKFFTIPLTYTGMNNAKGGTNFWNPNLHSKPMYTNLDQVVLIPNTEDFSTGSIYHRLPPANRQSQPRSENESLDQLFSAKTDTSGGATPNIELLGTFDFTIGAVSQPSSPFVSIQQQRLWTRSIGSYFVDDTICYNAYWLKPIGQTEVTQTNHTGTPILEIAYDTTVRFKYAAFDDPNDNHPPISSSGQNGSGLAGFIEFTYDESLPVIFGLISAAIYSDILSVNWNSETEYNNDHFDIELSKDGKTFTKIGEVASKAQNGQSSASLSYSFSYPVTSSGILAGIGILLMSSLWLSKKHKRVLWGTLLIISGLIFYSCTKNNQRNITAKDLFVRIAQVDKDGTKKYSKIVKAIVE